jgi:adenine-specific DNA-methyltransferase
MPTEQEYIIKIRELELELQKTKKQKRYWLVWENKPEDVVERCKKEFPVLVEDEEKRLKKTEDDLTHILIEGDNYHALSVLAYTHEKKIDVIYIDPPYNTGNQSWRYNNDYVDKDDPWKHSKWLSMMSNRLLIAKRILAQDGTLIVAIDDYEVHTLWLLLEEYFPSHAQDLIIIEHHPQGAWSTTVSRTHEYAFVLTPIGLWFRWRLTVAEEGSWSLKRTGQWENNWRKNRPKQFFAILIDEENKKVVGVGDNIDKDAKYPLWKNKQWHLQIYPLDREWWERCWRYNRESMLGLISEGKIIYTDRWNLIVRKDAVNAKPVFSIWKDSRYNAGTHGSALLNKILGVNNAFPYPKALWNVYDLLTMVIWKKDAIILDFFAGSGTTGHAVLELNKEDDWNRQFILCTNNENKIAEEVTYPRIRNVINGYADVEGAPANLRYYRTDFISTDKSIDDLRHRFILRCTKMLQIRENCFEVSKIFASDEYFQVFESTSSVLAVLYHPYEIEKLKKLIEKTDKPVIAYIFSMGTEIFQEELAEYGDRVRIETIPDEILETYKKIFGF